MAASERALAAPTTRAGSTRRRRALGAVATHGLLVGWGAASLVPFFWMVSTSLKEFGQVFLFPPVWIPDPITTEAYAKLLKNVPFLTWTINTFVVSATIMVGQLVSCSLAAYAFARLRFRGRDRLFVLYLGTLMIPYQVTLIPTYILFNRLGLINSYAVLILPSLFGGAFGTFLLRQFFMTIPQELEDAATIDGAGHFTIYRTIIMPLSGPALAALGVFVFMNHWNDFLWPLVTISETNRKTLTIGLATLQGQYNTEWTQMMAGAVLSLLPILIVFFAAQRYFVEGITLSGIKG
ncbi:MAG TPA: carbohydrate ABC transporter permease [Chloroflexota bacterium]